MRKKEKTKPSSRRANEIKKGLKDAITYERGDKTRARVVYPSADDYTRHEAMHMAHVILNMIDPLPDLGPVESGVRHGYRLTFLVWQGAGGATATSPAQPAPCS